MVASLPILNETFPFYKFSKILPLNIIDREASADPGKIKKKMKYLVLDINGETDIFL